MSSIIDIEGIGPECKKKLSVVDIKTTEVLLKKGATPKVKVEKNLKKKRHCTKTYLWVSNPCRLI